MKGKAIPGEERRRAPVEKNTHLEMGQCASSTVDTAFIYNVTNSHPEIPGWAYVTVSRSRKFVCCENFTFI